LSVYGVYRVLVRAGLVKPRKVERSHRTNDEEFYHQRGFRKPAKRRKELSRFLDFF